MKSCLFIFFAGYLWICSSTAQQAQPVNISLYFESLCGGCQYFIKNQYYPAFKSIGSIMNVHLIPYGNAEEKEQGGKWVFTCQHGKEECIGNVIETCAIHLYPKVSDYFPFIHCIETSNILPRTAAPICAQKLGLDYSKIQSCANSDLGNKLEHEMALKTETLDPPNQYVPWITVEGVHTEKIQNEAEDDLVGLICKTYKGSSKPAPCQKTQTSRGARRCLKNHDKVDGFNNMNSIDIIN